jgi:hypothetical protein
MSFLLLILAINAHRHYAEAHVLVTNHVQEERPTTTLVSPEPYYQKAQWLTAGILVLAIINLFWAIRTKHLITLASFLICFLLVVVAVVKTGVRY